VSKIETSGAPGVWVEARLVPFPRSISPEARASLANFVNRDGTPFPRAPSPALNDIAGWVEAKARANARMMPWIAARVANSTASVDTTEIGGALVHIATPRKSEWERCAYLDIHGGGLVYGGGEPCRIGAITAADLHGVRAFAVDYRMPPEYPYPAALNDCLAAYRGLLDQYLPQNIIVGGASAGGNLAAALMLRARDEGLPLPAAVVLITPELDLTESGDSFEVNRTVDVVLGGSLSDLNSLYANGHDLGHPYLSPLFGDFTKGFPPTFLQSGTRDLFLSNAVRMNRALRKAAVPVELHIFEGMPHGGFFGAPEDDDMKEEIARFVADLWGRNTTKP
jgi:monoterpene epsilon-lactone hydrolase